ncbi:MAG: ABC transporter permease [Oscillospiraceae bacterium]|jgi:ABC-2 type transport system permease protein|nr:ABC transporter permease [Oscillospiraceae bacterium]
MKTKQLKTVLFYEYGRYLHNKVFMVLTVAVTVIIFVALAFPRLMSLVNAAGEPGGEGEKPAVLIIDPQKFYSDETIFAATLTGYTFSVSRSPADDDALKKRIEDDELKAVLVVENPLELRIFQKENGFDSNLLAGQLQEICKQQLQISSLLDRGVSMNDAAAIVAGPQVELVTVGKSFLSAYIYTYALVMLLYMAIMLYGQFVATSVATEKSSRAMELLITSANPDALLFGKILGNGLAGLSQLSLWLVTILVGWRLNFAYWADNPVSTAFSSISPHILVLMVVFYVLGFFIFASAYGAVGSLVSRVEDIQTAATPLMLMVISSFTLGMFGMNFPEMAWVKVCSFIPVFTPMVMFVRVCMSDVPLWELVVSICLTAVAVALIALFSARIYRAGILMYGKPPTPKELVAALKNQKKY